MALGQNPKNAIDQLCRRGPNAAMDRVETRNEMMVCALEIRSHAITGTVVSLEQAILAIRRDTTRCSKLMQGHQDN